MNIFVSLILLLCIITFFSFFTGYINSRVTMIKKREKKFNELEQQGYNIKRKWHCNYMSIGVDEEKKIIACIVLGFRLQLYIFDIRDIREKIEIKISGVIPKMATSVCVVFKGKDNNFYFLRTLTIKKGFGVLKSGKTFKKAVAQAEEIIEVIEKCR